MSYSPEDSHGPVLNVTRARQARWGQHVFWVLVFGTLLAGLGMFLAWTWRSGTHEGPVGRGQEQVSGRHYDVPAPPTPATQDAPVAPK